MASGKKIAGLVTKPLVRHADERGDFREILRHTDAGFTKFAQLSTSVVYEGIAKAWHLHHQQTEWMGILLGVAKFAFADRRKNSPTFGLIEEYLVDSVANPLLFTVPAGIAHGYRIIQGPAVIAYITDQIYDPSDQLKIPHDDADIGYDWGPAPIR